MNLVEASGSILDKTSYIFLVINNVKLFIVMFSYNIYINNGVEAFGTEGKTITVNEVVQTADIKALAREIHHENMLMPGTTEMTAVARIKALR